MSHFDRDYKYLCGVPPKYDAQFHQDSSTPNAASGNRHPRSAGGLPGYTRELRMRYLDLNIAEERKKPFQFGKALLGDL